MNLSGLGCARLEQQQQFVDSRNTPGRLFMQQRSRNKTTEELVWYATLAETTPIRDGRRVEASVLFGWSVAASRSSRPGFELWLKEDPTGFLLTKMYLVPRTSLNNRNLVRMFEHQKRPVLSHKQHYTSMAAPDFERYLRRQFQDDSKTLPAIPEYVKRVYGALRSNYIENCMFAGMGLSTINTPTDTLNSKAQKLSIDNSLVSNRLNQHAMLATNSYEEEKKGQEMVVIHQRFNQNMLGGTSNLPLELSPLMTEEQGGHHN